MTKYLLFCVADEAKPFIPKAMREFSTEEDAHPMFFLVESNVCPDTAEGFKTELQDDEPFNSDFINASKEQCQSWARDKWCLTYNFIEQDLIAIADERSARDGTLLMSYYEPFLCEEEPTLDFEDWGPLPPKANTWYDFRIDHRSVDQFITLLMWVPPDFPYLNYFGRPEKLTNEAGVFDVFKTIPYI